LTFAGGWGGPELLFDTILGFEEDHRVVVVDVSPFADLDEMSAGVNRVLEAEGIDRVIVMGQSLSGLIAQSYFRRNPRRVIALVLTNTLAPRKERSKKWALGIVNALPLWLIKALIRKKVPRLMETATELPDDARNHLRFRGALVAAMIDTYFTKAGITNVLKLALAFNEKDGYSPGEFGDWPGRVLLVTSPDDPYHEDMALLERSLPRAAVFTLPSGFKHVAPQVHRDEFHAAIRRFIGDVGA
jgi:pimeloyl-ACP methyl ester carboxylesterase